MKFLPSAADSTAYGWELLLLTIVAALLPATGVFIWSVFFRKRGRRRIRRRRHRYPAATPANARTNGSPPAYHQENAPGEPKS